jgi:hypothetical protein
MDFMANFKKQGWCLKSGVCSIAGIVLTIFLVLSVAGCATFRNVSELYPPIMDQDELKRPYVKIAVLECSSERVGNIEGVTPQDYDWAHNALRERAYRLGADAVVLPEVRVERDTFLFFPSSKIRAKGIAIKFH